jgi:hypothetical protein
VLAISKALPVGEGGKMRINKVQWAGIILSALWLLCIFIYAWNDTKSSSANYADFAYRVCSHSPEVLKNHNLFKCDVERDKSEALFERGIFRNSALAALLPLPFFLLAAFCLLYIWRILVAGVRAIIPWHATSNWKRGGIVICAAYVSFIFLFCSMVVLNWYTDTKVPVTIGGAALVDSSSPGSDYVSADGTWRRDAQGGELSLERSKIICRRDLNQCWEAKAQVFGNSLLADLNSYDIQSWTKDAVVLKDEWPCATTIYTIDLNTKKMTGAGGRTNQASDLCKSYDDTGPENWSMTLSDGFPIYWEKRQKARPWALRLIQTAFGN